MIIRFVKRDLICRYNFLKQIIIDNASNLNKKLMTQLSKQFTIKHHNSDTYHLKMNQVVKVTNKNIERILEKMTKTYKGWYEKFPFALYAYKTIARRSTGAISFSLVYGIEAVVLIEVKIPLLKS